MGMKQGNISRIFEKYARFTEYVPRKIQRSAEFRFIAWLEENKEKLPGVNYNVEMQRDYNFGINGSHIFGYTAEISSEQLNMNKNVYALGDYVGNNGIENFPTEYARYGSAHFTIVY